MQQIAQNFSAIPDFLNGLADDDIGDATTAKMLAIVTNR